MYNDFFCVCKSFSWYFRGTLRGIIPRFVFYCGARGVILLLFLASLFGCYPSSVCRNHRADHEKPTERRTQTKRGRVGLLGFRFWAFFEPLLSKYKERKRLYFICTVFLYALQLVGFYVLRCVGVYSFLYSLISVCWCVGVVIFRGVFWWVLFCVGGVIFRAGKF